jgi:hypothetical protein
VGNEGSTRVGRDVPPLCAISEVVTLLHSMICVCNHGYDNITSFHFKLSLIMWLNGLNFIFDGDCVVEMA